ncbi:MAG: hypothetical protein ACK47M_17365, partial [Caldilinea sp.]
AVAGGMLRGEVEPIHTRATHSTSWTADRGEPRIQVLEWNAAPVLHSPGQVILEATSFRREYPGMRWGD